MKTYTITPLTMLGNEHKLVFPHRESRTWPIYEASTIFGDYIITLELDWQEGAYFRPPGKKDDLGTLKAQWEFLGRGGPDETREFIQAHHVAKAEGLLEAKG